MRIDYPDGAFETFTYNSFGQITSHRRRNDGVAPQAGGLETYTYDTSGRLTQYRDAHIISRPSIR